MFLERRVQKILERQPTIEGAGVRLKRVLGNDNNSTLDPFLLLDHFGSDNPKDYIKGFPWHPHRGMETVTYMWTGEVEHGDSMGNRGVIKEGDVQWMSAGSGIIHQEMPQKYEGLMQGFQLWVNLPAKKKMIDPKYRGIAKEQIPIVQKDGMKILIDRLMPLMTSETVRPTDGLSHPPEVLEKGLKAVVYRIKIDKKSGRFEKTYNEPDNNYHK